MDGRNLTPYILLESKVLSRLEKDINELIGMGYRKVSPVRCPKTAKDSYWCEMAVIDETPGIHVMDDGCETIAESEGNPSSRVDIYIHVASDGGAL